MSKQAGRMAGPRASGGGPGRGRALVKCALGLVLMVAALAVLWRYESRFAANARELADIGGNFVEVSADGVDPANEGKLIHLSALATSMEPLRDPDTGFTIDALALERGVDVYQWQETRHPASEDPGGGAEAATTYRKDWFRYPINSSRFLVPEGHENPEEVALQSRRFDAEAVSVGEFRLPSLLASRAVPPTEYQLTSEEFQGMSIYLDERARLVDGRVFIGDNIEEPAVGDTWVTYRLIPSPLPVSVVARQDGHSFGLYRTRTGRNIMEISRGTVAGSAMIGGARESWEWLWGIRLAMFFVGLLGLSLLANTPGFLDDILPSIDRLAGGGFGFALLQAGLALTLATIALAWIPFRPFIGVALLGVAVCAVMAAHKRSARVLR